MATSHAAIEQAAFALFAEHGFAGTTLDAIAREVGVGKRTLFRYYESKNDIPWGQFADTLTEFRRALDEVSDEVPVHEAVRLGVIEFNRVPPGAVPPHRERMRLLLTTAELQAHSVHQYAAWRRVIAEYVARRRGLGPDDLEPRLAGHVALALALTAYEAWLADPDADDTALLTILSDAMETLDRHLTD